MTTAEIIEQLRRSFELIRDERNLYANTATRIGNAFLSLLELFSNVSGLADQFKDIFLSSKENDIAEGIITFLNGLKVGNTGTYGIGGNGDAELNNIQGDSMNVVNAVVSGLLRAASAVINSLSSQSITTELLTVTGAAHFFTLIIDELRSVGGSVILTAANASVDLVDEVSTGVYRLSWRATDGEKKIYNQFLAGDGVICMTFNESAATGTGISNKYYWMRCTEAGTYTVDDEPYNYILLDSSQGSANNNAVPAVGDKIAQLGYNGNAPDAAQRQSAIIIAAYNSPDNGIYAPMLAHYSGISDFDLTSHRTSYISRDGSKFVGEFMVKTTNENNQTVYVDIISMLNDLAGDMEAIKQQTDGMMVIYFSYSAPSKSSAPASGWAEADYPRHVGDLYYDKGTASTTYGHAWQWSLVNGSYDWTEVTDQYTIAALRAAAEAQSEARQKIRCFAVTPYPPYDVNDLWFKDTGVMICVTAKADGETFAESDWVLKMASEDYKAFYERLYNVNPSAFDDNSRGYIDILRGTEHTIAEGNFYYTVDSNNTVTKLWQAQSSELVEITDTGAIEAIQQALSSYDFVNAGYRRIFLTIPTAPYYAGNIYVKKYNVYNALNKTQVAAGRDIYACTKSNNSSYSVTDWLRVSLSSSAELKVLGNIIRGLVYDSNGSSLLELTSRAITILNNAFLYDANGNITGTRISGLLTEAGATTLFANYLRDENYVKGSDLAIAVDGIAATVRGQNVYPNMFGFSDGLTFDGTCVPFIQAYGVEFVGSGNGYVRFGDKSVNGVTISFSAKAVGAETNVNFYINGNTGVKTMAIGTDWTDITLNVPSVTTLSYLRAYYSNEDVSTVALKNLKVESGNVATDFCISDADSSVVSNTNLFTTTVDYDRDPQSNFSGDNEGLDKTNTDGHGSVMGFYRSNNDSQQTWLFYAWTNPLKAFASGKVFTLSFWAKTGTLPSGVSFVRLQFGLWNPNIGTGTWRAYNLDGTYFDLDEAMSNNGQFIREITPSWKRYFVRFYINTSTTAKFVARINETGIPLIPLDTNSNVYFYIADVRFEEGYISDDSEKLSDKANSMALIRMSADSINLEVTDKLQRTGIDIENKKITLDAANTEVTGNFTAKKVNTTDIGNGRIAMEGGLMQVYNSVFTNPQIVFGVDENGNIVLTYYDGDGNVLWNLGPKGLKGAESQDEELRTYTNWCIPKYWNGSSWQQGWSDSEFHDIESYCGSEFASPTESFVAHILKRGIVTEYGLVYQYDARIVLGNFQAGNLATNDGTAKAYNKLFLNHAPSTSNKLVGEEIQSTGEYLPIAAWWATFMRIVRVEKWLTPYSMSTVTYDERTGKYYSVPDDYIDERGLEHGTDVDFEVLYDGDYTYKDPPVYFYLEVYEYGVFKERGVWYINSSNVFGL